MQEKPRESVVLTPDLLWVESSAPQKNRTLLIQEDNRAFIHDQTPPGRFPSLHLPGMVLPGFVDCHVHLGLLPSSLAASLAALKDAGIKAVRDAGDRHSRVLAEAVQETGSLPRVLPAGRAVTFPGGYGGFLGEPAANLQDGVELIARLAGEGSQVIKLVVTGLVDFCRESQVEGPYLVSREIKTLTRAAHARGLRVMAHANTDRGVREALAGDVDSIEHGYFMKEGTLMALAEKGTAWVPTLSPLWYLRQQEPDTEVGRQIQRTLEEQKKALKTAVELGVLVGVGTDLGASGVLPEQAYCQELLLYREAGLSWEEVLQAASFNGYKILGIEPWEGEGISTGMLVHLPRDLDGHFRAGTSGPVSLPF